MHPDAYAEMATLQDSHWWFIGRRAVLSRIIKALPLPPAAHILEIGSGMGGNIRMLQEFGEVTAVEADESARHWSQQRLGLRVLPGMLPDRLPDLREKFDLICLLDVLEHISDDAAALAALPPLLGDNGRILVTVPAYQWLWSAHDEKLHHFRRYTATGLESVARQSGYAIERISYFNTLLFPLAAATRLYARLSGTKTVAGNSLPPPFLNRMLRRVFEAESGMIRAVRFPFGVSILAVLRSRGSST
jgi:SAM-dependent methyltransferase